MTPEKEAYRAHAMVVSELLRVEEVFARYRDTDVLQGASLTARTGELVALIGPNGAGKSTLLKAVTGLVTIRRGRVWFNGADITFLPPEGRIARGIAYVPQVANVFPNLTIWEHLELGWRLAGRFGVKRPRQQAVAEMLQLFPDLSSRIHRLAGVLSGGERQMLAIARALIGGPRLLLLDEPCAGLSPAVAAVILERLRQVAAGGTAVLMVEQNIEAALSVAQKVLAMELGQVVLESSGEQLLQTGRITQLYFGGRSPAAWS